MRNKLATGLTALVLSLAPALPQTIHAGPNERPYKQQTIDDLPKEERIKAYEDRIIQAAKKYEREVIQKGKGDYKDIADPERAMKDYGKIIRQIEKNPEILTDKSKNILKNWEAHEKNYRKYIERAPWINPENITKTDKLYLILKEFEKDLGKVIGDAFREKFKNWNK